MDARQQQYLQAMGITPWVRREPDATQEAAVAEVAGPVVEAAPVPVPTAPSVRPTPPPVPVAEAPVPPVQPEPPPVIATPAGDWEGLAQQVEACQQCELYRTRLNAVLGSGNRQADWMVIGEAPGAEEDKQKEPFVGKAGQLLNAMLQAAGFRREAVYIANVLKCRPPNNRDPKPEEVSACSAYLQRQIELVQPKLILTLGRFAAQHLLGSELPMGQLRGRLHHYGEQQIPLVATYHPAYLLRTPSEKAKAWADLQLAMSVCPAAGGPT